VRYLTGGGALRKAESSRSVSTGPETQVSPGLWLGFLAALESAVLRPLADRWQSV